MRLVDFLLARITEDEAAARTSQRACIVDSRRGHWRPQGPGIHVKVVEQTPKPVKRPPLVADPLTHEHAFHIARHDPARVIADCEAKRQLIDLYRRLEQQSVEPMARALLASARRRGLYLSLQYMALPFASHSDYDERWRP